MDIKDAVLKCAKKDKIIFFGSDGYMAADIDEFIKQPLGGMLYDLNRLPEVILTFVDDPKWVNDYACYLVIKRLKEFYDAQQQTRIEDDKKL